MFKSAYYILKENFSNIFRIYSISKYELISEMEETKLGLFWNFAHPLIQVLTYWFAFGIVFDRKAVTYYHTTVPYVLWMMGGMVIWFFVAPCITDGCNAIYSKIAIITKMKFPVAILPATVIFKQLFNHVCLMVILTIIYIIGGYPPTIHWLGLIYYCLCAIIFGISLSLTTSVLTMLARDFRKLVLALMRLLLYMTPILWALEMKTKSIPHWAKSVLKINPVYYLVQGYRDCFFYHKGIWAYHNSMACFWIITLFLFFVGSALMYTFKQKLVDLI